MERYEDKIERALNYLKSPSKLSPTGYSPIVYMVYQPEDAFVVRGLIDSFLKPKAEYNGFHAFEFSMGEVIDKFINTNDYLDIWTDPDVEEDELYNSIKQSIVSDKYIEKALLTRQDELLAEEESPLLVIKDVEMLHPFYMIGAVENNIYNQILIPMLVLYPGETQGTARSFLGIYNQDGNYRSINF
jgi:hypothetical protein